VRSSDFRARQRKGVVAFLVLGVLTAIEYLVAGTGGVLLVVLAGIAALKGVMILESFMHLSQLWGDHEEG
jgi:heme/copper-type cytochrome/quinol oxidase subunit 4